MIAGIVNADFEPIISLSVCGSNGKVYTQDALVDNALPGSEMEIFYEPLLGLALKIPACGDLKTLESTLNIIWQQIGEAHDLVQLCVS